MKKLLLACALTTFAAAPALAADAVIYQPAPPAAAPVATVYDWSGFYVGAQVGGAWGDIEQRIPAYVPGLPDGDISGWAVGGYAGYYMHMAPVVLGVELGANWRDVDGDNGIDNDPETLVTEQKWDASLVAKVGVPVNRLLLYGLAGATVTEVESFYSDPAGDSTAGSDTVWGWTIGAGAEMAFTDRFHGRLEYRFADYAEADVTCGTCGPTFVDPQTHTVSVGLSYHW